MLQVTVEEGDGKMGWLLLRASLHDPLLVLNVESELEGGDPFFTLFAVHPKSISLMQSITLSLEH